MLLYQGWCVGRQCGAFNAVRIDHGLWRQPFFGVLAANLGHGSGGHLLHLRCSDTKSIGFLHGLVVSIALVGGQCLDTTFVGAG